MMRGEHHFIMPPIDIGAVLEPVSAEAPCGVDLEDANKYDPAFAELERVALGKAEQQIGNTLVPAEDPDWKVVQRKSTEILVRSKDLRAATHLAKALLRTDGWAGFAQGLGVLRGLVERYWDGLYPRLDPEDGNDPTMRVNILMSVADAAILSAVRGTPLVASRTIGRFSLKDLEAAAGDGAAEAGADPAALLTSIEAAVMDTDLPALQGTTAAVRACQEALTGLETALASHVGTAESVSFAKLSALVRKAEIFLAGKLAERTPGQAGEVPGPGATNGAGTGGWTGGIRSRDDVLKALAAISGYYEKHEPSSPIPIFMARCKRLVMMGFVDIVRELVPDAVAQVDVLRGRVE